MQNDGIMQNRRKEREGTRMNEKKKGIEDEVGTKVERRACLVKLRRRRCRRRRRRDRSGNNEQPTK